MNFIFNASGANVPVIKEFDIATSTSITAGAAVGLSSGLVVAASSASVILGVAAETHSGAADLLNPRANGKKLRVIISPDAVYEAPFQTLTASSTGTATTFVCAATNVSTSLAGGKLMLISKGASSTNTDKPGTTRAISACAISGTTATITVASGGKACSGDVYALINDPGTEIYLDSTGKGGVFYNSASSVKLITALNDLDRGMTLVKLKAPYLG